MKRLVLPLLALMLLWFLVFSSNEEPVSPPLEVQEPTLETPDPVVQSPPTPPPVPAPQPAPPVVNSTETTADGRPKPPKGTIPFVLEGNLVIAYGDVLIGQPTKPEFPEKGFVPIPKLLKWKGREIAFSVHQDLPNPERVLRVIQYFNENTPVRFVPLKDQVDSIVFAPSEVPLCLSYVGKIGGHQPIFLDDRCGEREITHEVMHALGFIHEHSRPDRDQYIRVNWQNIEIDKQSQFEIAPDSLAEPLKNRPFDYNSVMIYNDTDFGRIRGDITLESLDRDRKIAPVQYGLSAEDLERLYIIYGK